MKQRSRMLSMMAMLIVIAICSIVYAGMSRDAIRLTISDGETVSDTARLGSSGTIKLARVKPSTATTTTITLSSYAGPEIGTITVATATTSSTDTVTLSGFANLPIAGETRISATAGSAVDGDQTIDLLLYIDSGE